MLGGLIDDQVTEQSAKVPLLGDIPLLGRLFRSDSTTKVKRNLMVFIRPTIVRDQGTLSELSARKYNYIRAEQLVKSEQGINLFPFSDLAVLPEWTGMDASPPGILPSKPVPPPMTPAEDAVEKKQRKLSGENQPAPAPQ